MNHGYLLVSILLLFAGSCGFEAAQKEPAPCHYYEFTDGPHIKQFWEESCQNGKLDLWVHRLAQKLEKHLEQGALGIPYDTLEALGQEQFNRTMQSVSTVRGNTYRRVNRIFKTLVRHTLRTDVDYEIFVIRHQKQPGLINAWVTAHGKVFITTAMLEFVETEDELAFILSHELAHIENMLPDRRLALRGELRSVLGYSEIGTLLSNTTESALTSINQYHELIADRSALYFMNEAGFDPEGALQFFSRLDRTFNDNQSYFFLETLSNTHPYDHIRFNCASRYIFDSKRVVPGCEKSNELPAPNAAQFSKK